MCVVEISCETRTSEITKWNQLDFPLLLFNSEISDGNKCKSGIIFLIVLPKMSPWDVNTLLQYNVIEKIIPTYLSDVTSKQNCCSSHVQISKENHALNVCVFSIYLPNENLRMSDGSEFEIFNQQIIANLSRMRQT